MRKLRLFFLPCVIGLVFVTVFVRVGGADAAASSACHWHVVSSPNPSRQGFNSLNGVAAITANNIWAVGASSSTGQAIIEHWNGIRWNLVSNPVSGSSLNSVAAIAANNIWAVGDHSGQTLVEHWNGTRWSIVSSPNAPGRDVLTGVAATSSNDIWAVGNVVSNTAQPLIEHWNGTSWRLVPGPTPQLSGLRSVSAVSPGNIWAVGSFNSSSGGSLTLVEHWNGTTWATVTSPSPTSYSYLNGVVAVS